LAVNKRIPGVGWDQLDRLSELSLNLSNQLEHAEKSVLDRNLGLLEKSQYIANDRNFIRQLLEEAPIILLTQKLNGVILSVNASGKNLLETDSSTIIGTSFDVFIPTSDSEHKMNLSQLRATREPETLQIHGEVLTSTGRQLKVFWSHSLLESKSGNDEPLILTVGVELSPSPVKDHPIESALSHHCPPGLLAFETFREKLAAELTAAKRYDYRVALFYLELESKGFVRFTNHSLIADQLLQKAVPAIKDTIRASDILGSVDNEHYLIMMPHADQVGIHQNASKIIQNLKNLDGLPLEKSVGIDSHVGISIFPSHGLTANQLIDHAMLASEQAKD